mmetsp:Transcript_8620/g.10650  ORF Transcript_8620/g.10650 Transcript_8620/m.10650 type:complete len:97 (-) Transcript_8620:406-696(-)
MQDSRRNISKYRNLNSLGPSSVSGLSLGGAEGQANEDDFFFAHGGQGVNKDFLVDLFEDNMLEEVGSIDSKEEDEFFLAKNTSASVKDNQTTTSDR